MTNDAGRQAFLSLGGNIGDVVASFATSLAILNKQDDCRVTRRSSVWRTRPWGLEDQPDFLNMIAELETELEPEQLLEICQNIEIQAGRVRDQRWGPRTLDIDIIAFGNISINSNALQLPHPRACEREFVLAPLAELAPDFLLNGKTVARHLVKLQATSADDSVLVDADATRRLRASCE